MSSPPTREFRKRTWYIPGVILVITLGLLSRHYPDFFPSGLGKYPGDVLWALMVFLAWGILLPAAPTFYICISTLATSYAVEFLKLYPSPWLEHVRATTIGHLVFGSVFSWRNLVAYTIGVAIGATVECILAGHSGKFFKGQ